jgi:DNA-binding SARP family transcriptional activator
VGDSTKQTAHVRLHALGRFSFELAQVVAQGLATQKGRALLVYLIAHRGSDVGRERLLEVLWPEIDPERAKEGLRSALWSIRRVIRDAGFEPDEYLIANRAIVRWTAQAWLDTEEFFKLAQSHDAQELKQGLELYKGDFLEGDYEEWSVAERARLGTAYESLLANLVRVARNLEAAQLLLTRNPYDEPSYLVLIEADLSAGRVVSAAALAERCERALAEIGAQPSTALRQLVTGISSRRVQAIPRLSLPFVGRETELGKVRDILSAGTEVGHTLLISGEPGIGKSAFLSRAADLAQSLDRSVVSTRCFDTDTRPFGPFEELNADLHDEPLSPLATGDRADAAQRLAKSLISGLGSSTVISIDDAHTLKADARRVLSELAGQVCEHRHTLIVATRTEGLPDVIAAVSGCPTDTIVLGPLSVHDLRVAVDSVVADNQEIVAKTLFERSGGHPLFAATLLDSLAQSGVLRADHGTWRLVGMLDDHVALPKTLTAYIQARLHARGEIASAVAAALALEPAATADDMTAALHLPESQVFDALDDLLTLGVVIQPASGPQLAFAHEIYREVAASMLNAGRRTRLHRAFAERFASAPSPESSLRCARHLFLAGDVIGAAEAYYRAATEALEWGAWLEARDRCAAGIAGLENLECKPEIDALLARLKILAAKAHSALGDSYSAVATASDAVALARRSGESSTAIDAALARERAFVDDYRADAVLASAREVAGMARGAKDGAALAVALADQSWSQRLLGCEAEAIQAAHDAEESANAADDLDLACYALEQLLLSDVTWWRFADGQQVAGRSSQMVERASRPARIALHCALAAWGLVLDRTDAASSDINAAADLLRDDVDDRQRRTAQSPFGPSRLKLVLAAMAAQLALREGAFERALRFASDLDNMLSPRAHKLASLFRSDALFEMEIPNTTQGNGPMSFDQAHLFRQDVLSGIRSPALADSLNAATIKAADAPERLLIALDLVEAASRRTQLDADRAFAQLARAAERCGAQHVAVRAGMRRDDYRAMRAIASSRTFSPERTESRSR